MTNHTQKIAKKSVLRQIADNEAAVQAKYEIEQALLKGAHWQLWAEEKCLTTLVRNEYEFSVEWGKLIFAWWDEASSQNWRVTAYEIGAAEIYCQVTRGSGRETMFFTLRDPARWQPDNAEDVAAAERRQNFAQLLPQLINEHFHEVKLQRSNTRSRNSIAQLSQYVRLTLKQKKTTIFAVGINEAEAQTDVDGIITAALTFAATSKNTPHKIWIFVPHERAQTVLERLTLLCPTIRIECFAVEEKTRTIIALRPFSQAELLSLHPRGLRWPVQEKSVVSIWRERIVRLAPDIIEVRADAQQNFESYSIHGLEFARTYDAERRRVKFGVATYPDEIAAKFLPLQTESRLALTEGNFTRLENLVREIIAYRCAVTNDLRHPFYRLRAEAWLESLLRQDIRVLDATLDPRFVYSQVPAWIGEERGILDLLTINHAGRLVVIEIKAAEDAQLPLQGLDYWLRVEQARVRGEFARRGLFAGVTIADKSPLLYLVAPRLRFHRSFTLLANAIAPEIEAYRIGLNTNWRARVKVREFEKLGQINES